MDAEDDRTLIDPRANPWAMLAALPLFSGLPKSVVDEAVAGLEWLSLPGGRVLFEAGSPADAVYFVVSGCLGAYGPGASWTDIHMPPEQAVQAHRDLRARRLFPVHWATFNLAYHAWDEPIRRTVAAAREAGVALVTPRLGEWVDADRAFASRAWWEGVR